MLFDELTRRLGGGFAAERAEDGVAKLILGAAMDAPRPRRVHCELLDAAGQADDGTVTVAIANPTDGRVHPVEFRVLGRNFRAPCRRDIHVVRSSTYVFRRRAPCDRQRRRRRLRRRRPPHRLLLAATTTSGRAGAEAPPAADDDDVEEEEELPAVPVKEDAGGTDSRSTTIVDLEDDDDVEEEEPPPQPPQPAAEEPTDHWVQCERCAKWRRLARAADAAALPSNGTAR